MTWAQRPCVRSTRFTVPMGKEELIGTKTMVARTRMKESCQWIYRFWTMRSNSEADIGETGDNCPAWLRCHEFHAESIRRQRTPTYQRDWPNASRRLGAQDSARQAIDLRQRRANRGGRVTTARLSCYFRSRRSEIKDGLFRMAGMKAHLGVL